MEAASNRAIRAFETSIETTFGNATHVVESRTGPLTGALYDRLRENTDLVMTPVLETYGRIGSGDGDTDETVRVNGVEPSGYLKFRSEDQKSSLPGEGELSNRPLVVLSSDFRNRYGRGDRISLTVNAIERPLRVAGFLPDKQTRRTVLIGLAYLQKQFGKEGTLTRILIRVDEDDSPDEVRNQIGEDAVLYPVGRRTRSVRSMLDSFRWNLRALSFLALFVGGFLVYSTMYLYASRQTSMISLLKTLGTSDMEICVFLFGGLAVLGVFGSLLGIGIGLVFAGPLEKLVRGTVDQLYVPLFSEHQSISGSVVFVAFLLGLGTTLVGGFKPIWNRLGTPPRSWESHPGRREDENGHSFAYFSIGLGCFAGSSVLFLAIDHILAGFLSCFLIALGGSLMSPLLLNAVSRIPVGGTWSRMARRNVRFYGSRTAVMTAVLVAAFSLVLAVSFMVDSFRSTVDGWVESVVRADYYVRAVPEGSDRRKLALDEQFIENVREEKGVEAVGLLGETTVITKGGEPLTIRGIEPDVLHGRLHFQFNETDGGDPWKALEQGKVWLSEPGAYRLQRSAGDLLELPVSGGEQTSVRIGGVFNNYSTEWALVYMDLAVMRKRYRNVTISSAAVFADNDDDRHEVRQRLSNLCDRFGYYLETRDGIRRRAMKQFDRTFAVTGVMEVVASLVAALGLLILLISFTRSRAWIFGRLSAVGASRSLLAGLVSGEVALISVTAFLAAVPTGLYLSYVLIRVINRRAFGWLIPFQLRWSPVLTLLFLLSFTVVLSLAYPIYHLFNTPLSDLLEEGRG